MEELLRWPGAAAGFLETLPVHDGGAGLIVLLLRDPHLLEGGEGSQDGASDPDGVLQSMTTKVDRYL